MAALAHVRGKALRGQARGESAADVGRVVSQAMQLEVEAKRLVRDLDECYGLLEPSQADEE